MHDNPVPGWRARALAIGFPGVSAAVAWVLVAALLVPLASFVRFNRLSVPLLEPHPIRQTQTALTIRHFHKGEAGFFDYSSPYDGKLWNNVFELPIYQWLVAKVMAVGVSLEVASRAVTLFFFFVGLLVFVRLVRRYFGAHVAWWAGLLYYVSPFMVVYSRVCLIDVMALALLLLAIDGAARSLDLDGHARVAALCLFGVAGTLAALVKSTVWLGPAVVGSAWIAWSVVKGRLRVRRALPLAALLAFQLGIAGVWTKWATHIRVSKRSWAGAGAELEQWISGPLEWRLRVASWRAIGNYLSRYLLHDWMVPVFLVGLFLVPRERRWTAACAGIALISVLTTFNVHSAHDYYLIGDAPYLFLIAAIGAAWLFSGEAPRVVKAPIVAVTLALLVYRAATVRYVYTPTLAEKGDALAGIRQLAQVSDPQDLVFAAGGIEQWEIPLYSDRSVILSERFAGLGLEPSVFRFGEAQADLAVLSDAAQIWIDGGELDFPVYRVEARGAFRFVPTRHIAVARVAPAGTAAEPLGVGVHQIDACAGPRLHSLPETAGSSLSVTVLPSRRTFVLPRRAYLMLPSRSSWGCRFHITL